MNIICWISNKDIRMKYSNTSSMMIVDQSIMKWFGHIKGCMRKGRLQE